MKRWIVVALVLALGLMLAGCDTIGKVDNRMFMVVSDEISGMVMVDKATGVMYWKAAASGTSGILTLLVNADGTPRIWEG